MHDRPAPQQTLKELGYSFNDKGELRTIEGDQSFKFTTQEDYELLGDAMTHELYQLMESIGLQRTLLKKPTDNKPDDHYSFVFTSPGFDEKHTLFVLIHGMGAVRAGQWARRLILNESLDRGSQLPYIERALSNGWGVLVTNANLNEHLLDDDSLLPLQYSKNPEMHMASVWYRFVRYARANTIYVVAHSRGGNDISNIMEEFPSENRVACICLTDSWFEFPNNREQQPIVINWEARSKASMKKPVARGYRDDVKVHKIWAGTTEHERSSYMSIESIFHILENSPHESNIDRLLQDAWDIMDPPQLVPEGQLDKNHGKIISTDEDGNIKINEERFNVTETSAAAAEEDRNNNADGLGEGIEVPRAETSYDTDEPSSKQRRLRH